MTITHLLSVIDSHLSYFSTGFTFATAWVAMVEYTSAAVPEVSLGTVMGILHGVYWGLGIGGGQFLGGVLIHTFWCPCYFQNIYRSERCSRPFGIYCAEGRSTLIYV